MLKRKEFTLEVSTSPIENISALRLLAESNEWSLTTHEGSRLVDRFAIIIPMAQSAETWFRGDDDLSKDKLHLGRPREGRSNNMQLDNSTVKAMKRRWINSRMGGPFLGVLGNGRLENAVESAIYCLFSDAHARLSLS